MKQMIKSFLLGGIATAVEYLTFAIFNFLVFISLRNIPFYFFVYNYNIEDGGLCAFLSYACSYLIAQIVNYFVQKKYTFSFNKTNPKGFVKYVISVFVVYIIVLIIPGLISSYINNLTNVSIGPLITKSISMFAGFLIQFPINKYIVFKKAH